MAVSVLGLTALGYAGTLKEREQLAIAIKQSAEVRIRQGDLAGSPVRSRCRSRAAGSRRRAVGRTQVRRPGLTAPLPSPDRKQRGGSINSSGEPADRPVKRTRFAAGMLLCLASGVLSPMLNLVLAFGTSIRRAALAGGAQPFFADNAVWAVGVSAGMLVNVAFSAGLLTKHRTWRLFCGRRRWGPLARPAAHPHVDLFWRNGPRFPGGAAR
jgi:hypothetical protein